MIKLDVIPLQAGEAKGQFGAEACYQAMYDGMTRYNQIKSLYYRWHTVGGEQVGAYFDFSTATARRIVNVSALAVAGAIQPGGSDEQTRS